MPDFTKQELVAKMRATLNLRNAADALILKADADEAAVEAMMVTQGYDVGELVAKAYGV